MFDYTLLSDVNTGQDSHATIVVMFKSSLKHSILMYAAMIQLGYFTYFWTYSNISLSTKQVLYTYC
jgi:hypothetical protein